jgi:DNA-directed RNA polymerase II subunit RPB2
MTSETHNWNILGAHFKEKGFVSHQIESFDDYINVGISRVLDDEPDIVISQNPGEVYTVSFENVYVPPPTIIEEDRVLRTVFFPSEVRQRDLTYDSPIYADITETFEEEGKETEQTIHRRIVIGRTPIMIRSSRCHLTPCTPDERIKHGECEFDNGGYFLIRGKERVLISQLRNTYNKVLVISQKTDSKMEYVAEIRSISEETGHSVLVQVLIGRDKRKLVFSLPYIKDQLPIGVVFKAMGYTTTDEIADLIGLDIDKAKIFIKLISRDSYFIKDQEAALKYIGQFAMHTLKDCERRDYAWQVVENELFPHMGVTTTVKEKAYFLGYMVNKLLSTHLKIRQKDDRDNYMNKRVETAGVLCCDLFRTLFKRYTSVIKQQLEKKKQHPDAMSIIYRLKSITTGLQHSFSTVNWGVQKNSYTRTGVSQVLSRLTFGATLSHLRRIMMQTGKEGKNSGIRQINPSQIMYICPAETPEGQPVGTVLNLSLLTKVSNRTSTVFVKEVIESSDGMVSITDFEEKNDQTMVLLNGVLVGMAEDPYALVDELKMFRDVELLPFDVSISFDDIEDEINIFSDDGRLLRPVFTVEGDHIVATEDDGIDWDTLIKKKLVQYFDNSEINGMVIAFNQEELKNYKNDCCEIAAAMMLGVMASIIPFPDHSQSPRNCYQSAMGKQAMGMFALSHLLRTDTVVHVLGYPQKPLVSTKAAEIMGFSDMPSGINCIVGIMAYTGFNQEDSIMKSRGAVDRDLFTAFTYRCHSQEEKKQGTYTFEKIGCPPLDIRRQDVNYNMLDERGVVKKGSHVEKGDVIIGKTVIESDKSGDEELSDCSLVLKKGEDGVVDTIVESITPNGYRLVKVTIRKLRVPEVGDKFASRAAQKGTIGMILNEEDMPFTSEGIRPDIIINPHCIPSRMTVNQLMECVLGKACLMNGEFGDATPFTSSSVNVADQLCDNLGKAGYQRNGYETMYNGMTGEMMEVQIFIGPTYYQRLKHLVSDKIHARADGPITTLTRQPLEGRSRDGGLRFGEMERDCMIAHGTSRFLKERLFDQSDPYTVVICDECGCIATTQTNCRSCETDMVSKVNLPYASKLLLQELNAMCVKTSITAKK